MATGEVRSDSEVLTDEDENRLSRGSIALLALPSFVWLLAAFVLPPPAPIQPLANHLDPSWQIVITDAFLHGMQFGRDLVYTYGPWGFLRASRGDSQIYPWLLGGRLLLAAAFAAGVALLAKRKLRHPLARHVFALSVAVLSDPILVLPMVLLAVILSRKEEPAGRDPVRDLIAVACALVVWIKFTMFVAVLALAAVLAIQDVMRRRLPRISGIIVVAALAFWLLARQSISGLVPFVHDSLSTAMSYSSVMYEQGSLWHVVVAALLLLLVALPCALRVFRQRLWFLWPSALWIALLFFLHLKEAFVRHDLLHVWWGMITGALPCGLILLCLGGIFRPGRYATPGIRVLNRVCAVSVILIGVAFPAALLASHNGPELFKDLMSPSRALVNMLEGQSLGARYEQELNRFQHEKPLTRVPGRASVYPDDLAVLYGNRQPVRLPPIPQAFAAYNPYLSGRNAAFYRSIGRSDFIYFEIDPIDDRFPTSSDGQSLLAFLDCYSPWGNSGQYLILAASGCGNVSPELLSELTTPLADSIQVPAAPPGYAIWVQFNVRLNTAGSLVSLLSHPPPIQLRVTTSGGQKIFRISADAGMTGFILSPLVSETESFKHLYSGSSDPSNDVTRMEIVRGNTGAMLYQSTVSVRFSRVRLPSR